MPNNTESNRPDSTFPEIRIVGDWPADFDEERALGHSPTAVRLSVHGHVETISTLLWKQAARLYFSDPREGRAFDKALGEIKGDTLAFQVSYPLKKIVEVHVRPLAWGKPTRSSRSSGKSPMLTGSSTRRKRSRWAKRSMLGELAPS